MVTPKIASPATLAPSESATKAAAAAAAPATPARLPARKKAIATKPAVKKAFVQPVTPSRPPEKTSCQPMSTSAEKMSTPEKIKKIKMVRDNFTMPKTDYATLTELKQRAGKLGRPLKKSELLRAGLKLLNTLSDADLLSALTDPAPRNKSK